MVLFSCADFLLLRETQDSGQRARLHGDRGDAGKVCVRKIAQDMSREASRERRCTLIPSELSSEGSIGETLGGRGSAQKRCQPLVKCDGNCSAMPAKTW